MNTTETTSPRKVLTVSALVIAIILEPICFGWTFFLGSAGTPFGDFLDGPTLAYYLVSSVALLAGVTVFIAGRSRWRWLLLLIFLPFVGYFALAILSEVLEYMRNRG